MLLHLRHRYKITVITVKITTFRHLDLLRLTLQPLTPRLLPILLLQPQLETTTTTPLIARIPITKITLAPTPVTVSKTITTPIRRITTHTTTTTITITMLTILKIITVRTIMRIHPTLILTVDMRTNLVISTTTPTVLALLMIGVMVGVKIMGIIKMSMIVVVGGVDFWGFSSHAPIFEMSASKF